MTLTWRNSDKQVAPPQLDQLRAWAIHQIVFASNSQIGETFRVSGVLVLTNLHPDNLPPEPITDEYVFDMIKLWADENGVPDFQVARALRLYAKVPEAEEVPVPILANFYAGLVNDNFDDQFTPSKNKFRGVTDSTLKELLEENNRLLRVIADRVSEPTRVLLSTKDEAW